MAERVNEASMEVTLAWAPEPRVVHVLALKLAPGARVRDAVAAAAQDARFANLPAGVSYGVWNHRMPLSHLLSDGDRVEIYRPLRVDPMVARRERFKKQGARTAGLFAKRRPGAKSGY